MATFAAELKQAWRSLLQRKAYFFTCAATLALVLGANASMFAVVNATMLRPMPSMAAPIAQGRAFLESEGEPGQFVAVITDRYWRDTLGAGSVLGSVARH